jgi:hypothetical protein
LCHVQRQAPVPTRCPLPSYPVSSKATTRCSSLSRSLFSSSGPHPSRGAPRRLCCASECVPPARQPWLLPTVQAKCNWQRFLMQWLRLPPPTRTNLQRQLAPPRPVDGPKVTMRRLRELFTPIRWVCLRPYLRLAVLWVEPVWKKEVEHFRHKPTGVSHAMPTHRIFMDTARWLLPC